MRITRGEFKGRRIKPPEDIRPVSEMVRKACFDILGREVEGRSVLDLFSGSGALGIEAISCGARQAVFVDSSQHSCSIIRQNIADLGLKDLSQVIVGEAVMAISRFYCQRRKFDLVFLDPPYYQGLLRKALQAFSEYDIVTNLGYLVGFCYCKDELFSAGLKGFSLVSDKKYGQTRLVVYRKEDEEPRHISGNV